MEISDASRQIFDMHRWLPKWNYLMGEYRRSYCVSWDYPDFYKKHIEKVCQSSKLQQRICEKSQEVLDSGQFNIDEVVIIFSESGMVIGVEPGDACGISPGQMGNLGNHNIDSPAQCFSLLFLLITALEEIYRMMMIWEDRPHQDIDTGVDDKICHLERSLESMPYVLWQVGEVGSPHAYIVARTFKEADELAEKGDLGDMKGRYFPSEPMVLSACQIYKVIVSFDESCQTKSCIYEVIAANSDEAKEMVEEMFKHCPSLYPVKNIEAQKESEPILPSVISSVWEKYK